jgi:hypothetical protein
MRAIMHEDPDRAQEAAKATVVPDRAITLRGTNFEKPHVFGLVSKFSEYSPQRQRSASSFPG